VNYHFFLKRAKILKKNEIFDNKSLFFNESKNKTRNSINTKKRGTFAVYTDT